MRSTLRWIGPLLTTSLLVMLVSSACVDRTSHAEQGAVLYATHCAACHGPEGRGDGPVAPELTPPPADLTRLAARAGRFDEAAVLAAIDGRRAVAAHGPREMPVWGRVFEAERSGEAMPVYRAIGDSRALVDYLRTLQRP